MHIGYWNVDRGRLTANENRYPFRAQTVESYLFESRQFNNKSFILRSVGLWEGGCAYPADLFKGDSYYPWSSGMDVLPNQAEAASDSAALLNKFIRMRCRNYQG